MQWIKSRRLRYLAGSTAILLLTLALLRFVFLFGFADIDLRTIDSSALWKTVGIGLRFDLRLALLIMLPLALLCYLPFWNMSGSRRARLLGNVYLAVALLAVGLVYVIDFGHYNYLGVRINATVLRFAGDADISGTMLWQSYPVVWITLGWLGGCAAVLLALFSLERVTLERRPVGISRKSAALGSAVVVLLVFLGVMGRVSDINIKNPIPLRWSDAFFSGDRQLAAAGLNPVIFLYDTLLIPQDPYDRETVANYYDTMVDYLGIDQPDRKALNFVRHIGTQPHRLSVERPPNVIFIMLESLGASRVGAYGNPLKPTPNLDAIAADSWFFRHFYIPVVSTAKTVWASITGIPDVSREETASRNPLITRQHTLLNAFEGYRKLYMIGGSAGWANLSALIRESTGMELIQEGDWQSPNADVWGISDLNLFKEADRILRDLPADEPFFAYIQTAGNHRPFTIPTDNDDFKTVELPLEEVQKWGFRSVEQFNAVRLIDYDIGRFLQMARESGYFDNTLFVFFGDHNNRITTIPHMPPAFEQLGLESNHVPHMIYAPALLQPRVIDEAVNLVDVLPTVAGLAGLEYTNRTMGRDLQLSSQGRDRAVPLVLEEGSFPVIGAVTSEYLVKMNCDGSEATLHELSSDSPLEDVSGRHPEEFDRLRKVAHGAYETSRYMLYDNARK
ncbi:LTA synthase family protein [Desulfuromonas sp. TF]|uniref:LTA synthase family protein n=1 Tax=Desulfuromonas sp. TF TaxID=1232410 RepID=UPI0003F5FBFC|nr:LTA synthase family protein [Desulfuromonas sp. TF]